MKPASPADGEAMPKIPDSNIHRGSEPVDELDFALDILRVARVALQSPDTTNICEEDIRAAGNCVSYAMDALRAIRPVVNPLAQKVRQ